MLMTSCEYGEYRRTSDCTLNTLGNGEVQNWLAMAHPKDLPGAFYGVRHLNAFLRGRSHRLFAKYRIAVFGEFGDDAGVHLVLYGDHYRIDQCLSRASDHCLGSLHKLIERVECQLWGNVVCRDHKFASLRAWFSDRDDPEFVRALESAPGIILTKTPIIILIN